MTDNGGAASAAPTVLSEVRAFVRRFVVVGEAEAAALALWAMHTHALSAADSTPYLHITSAEGECGKTQLLEVLEAIVARPWLTGRTSAAVLPRKIEREAPTLLLDEADNVFGGASEYVANLLEVLNTGYRRSGKATINVPDGNGGWIDRGFATFCPKAIAGIGALPGALPSRCIEVRLERRLTSELIDPWFSSEPPPEASALHERCAAWAVEHLDELVARRRVVERPAGLGDRAFDVWRPLLAIAELQGESASEAATALSARAVHTSEAKHALSALAELFTRDDNVSTHAIANALNADDDLPFADKHRGEGCRNRDVAKLLKVYGLRTRDVRIAGSAPRKGYRLVDCAEILARYLPHPSATSATSATSKPQSQANVADVADVADGRGAPTELPPKGDLERSRTERRGVDPATREALRREFT
jgi:hypothetical protein